MNDKEPSIGEIAGVWRKECLRCGLVFYGGKGQDECQSCVMGGRNIDGFKLNTDKETQQRTIKVNDVEKARKKTVADFLYEARTRATWPVMKDGKMTGEALSSVNDAAYERLCLLVSRQDRLLDQIQGYCEDAYNVGGFKISHLMMILEKTTSLRGIRGDQG